jgi:hypothetical protein
VTDWSFQEQIKKYCINDVVILAQICLQYHNENVEKRGTSPWLSITAPGYCHTIIKNQLSTDEYLKLPPDTPANDMARRERLSQLAMEEHWAVLTPNEYWFARKALRGGRTDVRRLTYTLSQEDIAAGKQIRYVDIVSMYPSVQVKNDYPVGVPEVRVYDLDYYPCRLHSTPDRGNTVSLTCSCSYEEKFLNRDRKMIIYNYSQNIPTWQEIVDDDDFFGLVCVSLTPPTNLYIPVLVTYNEGASKCNADLIPITAQVFTSVELKVAFRKGYQLDRIHRFDKYHKAPGLWNDFIKKLFIDKMSNELEVNDDGIVQYPSIENQNRLVDAYERNFGMGNAVRESLAVGWSCNPVKKQVAKIMLNSGWGKHCQRLNLPQTQIIGHKNTAAQTALIQRYEAGYIQFTNIVHMTNGTAYEKLELSTSYHNIHDSYIAAGLFVPSYGRLVLYEQMQHLRERVLYHDTDSIIYIYDPSEDYNIPMSDIWGDWKEEKESVAGIVSFTGIAPKSYGLRYRDGKGGFKERTKFKGVSVKHAHREILNLKSMEDMVAAHWRNEEMIVKVPQFGIRFEKKGLTTYTTNSIKDVQFNYDQLKGDLHADGLVYPKGYCPGCKPGNDFDHTCIEHPAFE